MKGTLSAVQQIEEEKSRLFKQTESLQANLDVSKHFKNTFSYHSFPLSLSLPLSQSLTTEKELTTAQLEEREKLTKQLEEEKKTLEEATSHLKGDLMVRLDNNLV